MPSICGRTLSACILLIASHLAPKAMAQAADDPSVSYEQRLLELETELQALRSERQVSEPRPSATDGQDVQQAGYASFLEQNGATQQWRPPAVPQFFTRTEYPTVNWSGFLQLDNGDIVQDETNEGADGTAERTEAGPPQSVRRHSRAYALRGRSRFRGLGTPEFP